MNKMDSLQKAINDGLRTEVTILDSTDKYVLARYTKGDVTEYVTFQHDYKSVFQGHYFNTFGTHEAEARDNAWTDYRKRQNI